MRSVCGCMPTSSAAPLRRASPLDAQELAALGAGGDLQRYGAFRSRHLDARAERSVRERDRHVDDEIRAAALVERRVGDARDDDQVARRAATESGLALPFQANLRTVLDAGRDLHRVALRPALAAGPVAARTRLREPEEALALDGHAAALALRANLRRRAGLRPGAAALAAGGLRLDRDLRLDSAQRILERQAHLHLEIRPSAGTLPLRATSEDVTQPAEAAEEVADVTEVEIDSGAAGEAPAVPRAERVVLLALVGVGEDVVGGLDLLEPLLGLLVARVLVGVVLADELAVGLLDLVLRRGLRDAEGVVEAPSPRCHPHPPSGLPPRPLRAAGRGRRGGNPSGARRSPSPPRGRTAG